MRTIDVTLEVRDLPLGALDGDNPAHYEIVEHGIDTADLLEEEHRLEAQLEQLVTRIQ